MSREGSDTFYIITTLKKMKIILIFSIVLFSISSSFSQNYQTRIDSLAFELKKEKERTDDLFSRVDQHYNSYHSGSAFEVLGGLIVVASTILAVTSTENDQRSTYLGIGLAGSGIALIGRIIQIRSHRFFNRKLNLKNNKIKEKSRLD